MSRRFTTMVFVLCFLTLLLCFGFAEASFLIGGEDFYIVQKGDTLDLIASKLGLRADRIASDNGIPKDSRRLKPGTFLKIYNRRIVPKTMQNGILINIPERMLYYFKDNHLEMVFPVGLGKIFSYSDTKWHTPVGQFVVTGKQKDPVWYVPASIQREMELQGKPVELIVSPGPDNPLGRFVVRTTLHNIHIHETNQPASVHKFSSHGCIRVLPQHMEVFFKKVERNTPGEIIYQPIKVHSEGNKVYLEVHRDYYKRLPDFKAETKRLIEQTGRSKNVDWNKVEKLLAELPGVAIDVTSY